MKNLSSTDSRTCEIASYLENTTIKTWFDIGYFLDQLKNMKPLRSSSSPTSKIELLSGYRDGIAFMTFDLGLDGVTVEMMKYAAALSEVLGKNTPIHWLTGNIDPSIRYFKDFNQKVLTVPLMQGFEKSGQVYKALFHTKLRRGDDLYNALPKQIWNETLLLCQDLLEYIEKNNIKLILTANTDSNPGNISLTLALVIISQLYGISIISTNHDFYWEGGSDRKNGQKKGPRDHFFKNSNIGEIFSIIQILYPWDSPYWIHANINTMQTETIVKNLGFNPFGVTEVTSSINTSIYRPLLKNEKQIAYDKLNKLLGEDGIRVSSEDDDYFSILEQEQPVVISNSSHDLMINNSTLLFLQPTRIISRKRIEKDLTIIEQLFLSLKEKGKDKTIVLLITGPIASGSKQYVKKLLTHTRALFRRLGKHDHKIFIAFKLGKDTTKSFLPNGFSPIRMNELYGVSSFVMLPSKQEGRGLPILESAASEVPLIASRFDPEDVYEEVIGFNLDEKERIKVLELPENKIGLEFVEKITELILDPEKQKAMTLHNRKVIQSRYSMKKLEEDFIKFLEKTWLKKRSHANHKKLAKSALLYMKQTGQDGCDVIFNQNRSYIPGVMKYRFLSQVKSIIDPCYFRIEEKQTLGEIYSYAKKRIPADATEDQREFFFNSIRKMFSVTHGKYGVELDTTFDYRYRDNSIYLWRELTEPQLFGAIIYIENILFNKPENGRIIKEFLPRLTLLMNNSKLIKEIDRNCFKTAAIDFNMLTETVGTEKPDDFAIRQLETAMVVDDLKIFKKRIVERPQDLVIFAGEYGDIACDLFMYDQIIKVWDNKKSNYSLTFVCRQERFNSDITIKDLEQIIGLNLYPNLNAAFKKNLVKIIPIGSKSLSVDLSQISPELKNALIKTKKNNGHVLAKGEYNYFSLDMLDIPSFRYGTIHSLRTQAAFDTPAGTSFFQFVPAGLRTFFGFPFTIETPAQFSKVLNAAYDFNNEKLAEQNLQKLKVYLDNHGTSLKNAVAVLADEKSGRNRTIVKRLAGKYSDGSTWTGVSASLELNKNKYSCHVLSPKQKKTIPQFVQTLERTVKDKTIMGWNGGYILNTELVGKLNLPENFVGSPLGFIVSNSRIMSLPLYNRPIFAIKKNKRVLIDRLKLDFSGRVFYRKKLLFGWDKNSINPSSPLLDKPVLYTPLSGLEKIPVADRIIIVIGGRRILRLSYPESGAELHAPLFRAGVTFSLPSSMRNQLEGLRINMEINYDLDLPPKYAELSEAVEAGPLLIRDGKIEIDLEEEGWLLKHSILTQAARRDRENERGPKIGCGVSKKGEIICVVIESRIRESIGATYEELASVLKKEGAIVAMGFDPGGSATLWADGVKNIVPYTDTFNKHPLIGKPQPRPVTNAVLITEK